ncbi:MAG: helix-turn-helix transcriptional regulator [Spirochaetota bacterium]
MSVHYLFWLHILVLLFGSASIAVTLLVRAQHPGLLVGRFAYLVVALFWIVASMTLQQYSLIANPDVEYGVALAALLCAILGSSLYMFFAPCFYHSLVGRVITPALRTLYLALGFVFVLTAAVVYFRPSFIPAVIALNLLLFGMIVYGLVYVAFRYRFIGDPRLRRALRVFFLVLAASLPLMYLDSPATDRFALPILEPFDGMTVPLFFAVINILAIRFASTYLNEPPYLYDGALSEYFRSTFDIGERESRITRMLVAGASVPEIATTLSISADSVERDIHTVCRKTRVGKPEQLVHLIIEHRGSVTQLADNP